MKRRSAVATALAAIGFYGYLQWLGRTYGATAEERRRGLPGDDLCADPQIVTTHAINIEKPPADIWPWLVQMGWGRGQWYTARWVDRLLFPSNGPSADRIIPELQRLAIGDRVLDGPPEANCAFIVRDLEPNRHLVLHSREHLPPGWVERFGATIDFSWAFVLQPIGQGNTRFIFRSRSRLTPRWVAVFYALFMAPADFVMSRQMMRGLRSRVRSSVGVSVEMPSGPGDAPGAMGPLAPNAGTYSSPTHVG